MGKASPFIYAWWRMFQWIWATIGFGNGLSFFNRICSDLTRSVEYQYSIPGNGRQRPLLLLWINLYPGINHILGKSGWWNYLFIPKLLRYNRWSLGMDKYFTPHFIMDVWYHLSMLEKKLNDISKRGHGGHPLCKKLQLQLWITTYVITLIRRLHLWK